MLALYAVHAANVLIPLVTIPYLARVLRPQGWGALALAQTLAIYITMLIEYGFNISAAREVARYQGRPERFPDIVAGVWGAKLLLACAAILLSSALYFCVPALRAQPALIAAAVGWGIIQGFSPIWFFQGVERLAVSSVIDCACKITAVGLTFRFVKETQDGWRVLAFAAAASALSNIILSFLAYQSVRFQLPTRKLTFDAMAMGWNMFIYRGTVSLYTTANTFLVGLFAPPAAVAFFTGADRIARAGRASLDPIMRSIFPRVSNMVQHSVQEGRRFIWRVAWVLGLASTAGGAVLFIFAPTIVRIMLGPGYEAAAPVLRIMSLLAPLITMAMTLGNMWAQPLGFDAHINRIIITAGALNIALACVLVPLLQARGMAFVVVATEAFVLAAHYEMLRKRDLLPCRSANSDEPGPLLSIVATS
jgi:PST family polysaccharide transporter